MFVSARKLFDIAVIACLVYPSAQSAFGQVARPAAPPAGQVAPNGQFNQNRTFAPEGRDAGRDGRHDQDRFLQGSTIIGANVMLQGGGAYGTVRDFVLTDSGCLEYAVIAADNGLYAVPWTAGTFDYGRHAFMLGFGRDRVRDLPRIRDIAELRNPQIQQRVQTFYRGDHNNMRNGEQRGAENRGAQNRGAENRGVENRGVENRGTQQPQTQPTQPRRGTTVRGAERPAAPERPATGNESREK